MILSRDGIETKVKVIPYTESSIQNGEFLQTPTATVPIEITSVKNYEERLVRITLPDGGSAVVSSDQMITAIQKCVL